MANTFPNFHTGTSFEAKSTLCEKSYCFSISPISALRKHKCLGKKIWRQLELKNCNLSQLSDHSKE